MTISVGYICKSSHRLLGLLYGSVSVGGWEAQEAGTMVDGDTESVESSTIRHLTCYQPHRGWKKCQRNQSVTFGCVIIARLLRLGDLLSFLYERSRRRVFIAEWHCIGSFAVLRGCTNRTTHYQSITGNTGIPSLSHCFVEAEAIGENARCPQVKLWEWIAWLLTWALHSSVQTERSRPFPSSRKYLMNEESKRQTRKWPRQMLCLRRGKRSGAEPDQKSRGKFGKTSWLSWASHWAPPPARLPVCTAERT